MDAITTRVRREFLFLQGPPGPFFFELSRALAESGDGVHRINLSGGDLRDWTVGATNYRGRKRDWPMFFDRYLRTNRITDLILFGDCRPMHQAALRMAQLRGIHIHVFEEGYIRPDWMTLERDGVNGHSPIVKDPDIILDAARWLPPVQKLPPITADFRRRARDSFQHYFHVFIGKAAFPFYRCHRQGSLAADAVGWAYRFVRQRWRSRQADRTLAEIANRPYYLFPLQLTGDYQIRSHSPFGSMPVAVDFVLDSFAQFAPPDTVLLVKEHPLDSGFRNWRTYLRRRARKLGISHRVRHIDGGELDSLAENSLGMVCVNSTSGTLALEVGIPVAVLGDAVYDIPGITHQAGIDLFWSSPEMPDPVLYEAFKRMLHARCLVRGGLASESAVRTLVANSVKRLKSEGIANLRHDSLSVLTTQAEGSRPESSR